jgi:hypothetical protein
MLAYRSSRSKSSRQRPPLLASHTMPSATRSGNIFIEVIHTPGGSVQQCGGSVPSAVNFEHATVVFAAIYNPASRPLHHAIERHVVAHDHSAHRASSSSRRRPSCGEVVRRC